MEPVRLNIGCGADIMYGHVNVDIRDLPGVDVVADIVNLPFDDSTVDVIMMHDVLEHFVLYEAMKVLRECYRVLVDDGQLTVRVPDVLILADLVREDKITAFDFQEFLYGRQDYEENIHKSGYTPQFLAGIFSAIGFKRVDLIEHVFPNIRMLVKK